ncbi:hypothetical protein N2152v2_001476 [Parachlorella kessleri]
MAEVGQYAKSKQLEAELQRILEARGATLQKLQSSPKVEATSNPRSQAIRASGNVQADLSLSQAGSLQAELERENAEIEELRRALEASRRELEAQRQQAEQAQQEAKQARQQAEQEAKQARQQAELEAKQAQQEAKQALQQAELETKQAQQEIKQAQQRADLEVRQAQQQQQQQAAPAAPAPTESIAPQEGTSGFSLLNVVGIIAAGGLAGYFTLFKKQKQEEETTFQTQLQAERSEVSGLKGQVEAAKEALQREQELVEKIKKEAAAATANAQRQLELERESREAVVKEKSLVERALAAEQQLVDAVKKEAAATDEALQAERAAKYTADAEAAELQRMLDEVHASLDKERQFTQRLGEEATRTKAQLQGAMQSSATLAAQSAALEGQLGEERERIEELQSAAADLEHQLAEANQQAEPQKVAFERVGKETMSLREALRLMKQQAAEMAVKAQQQAEEAAWQRAEADSRFGAVHEELQQERDRIAQIESELGAARQDLADRNGRVQQLEQELTAATSTVNQLRGEVQGLSAKVEETSRALAGERQASQAARAEAVSLRSELSAVQSDLSQVSNQLMQERSASEEMRDALSNIKQEYHRMEDRLEQEQNTVLNLRRESGEVRKMMNELETRNRLLTTNLQQSETSYQAKLQAAENRLNQAGQELQTEREAREDAAAAVAKLESVISVVRNEMMEAQEAANKVRMDFNAERSARLDAEVRMDFNAERSARLDAEEAVARLRQELNGIAQAEQAARRAAEASVAQLQQEFEVARAKVEALQAQAASQGPKVRRPRKAAAAAPSADTPADADSASPEEAASAPASAGEGPNGSGSSGPPSVWLLGNLPEIAKKGPHLAYQEWGKKYGPIFRVWFGGTLVVVVSEDPYMIRKAARSSAWRAGIRFLSVGKERRFDSYNIIASRGETWRAAANAWHPFFQKSSLATLVPFMVKTADRLSQALEEHADSGEELDVHREFGKLALDVVGTTAFGVDFHSVQPKGKEGSAARDGAADNTAEQLTVAVRAIFDAFGLISIWMMLLVLFPHFELLVRYAANIFPAARLTKRAREARMVSHGVAVRLLQEHRQAAANGDGPAVGDKGRAKAGAGSFLALQTRAVDKATGKPFPDEWVTSQVLTFIGGGYETTAAALATSVYELSRHPDKEAKLLAEVDAFGDKVPGVDDLEAFPYTTAVWKEALRLYPPGVFNGREMQRDVNLGGYHLPKGTTIHGAVFSMHHSPNNWQVPEAFLPERFLEGSPESKGVNLEAYMPFGDGPRMCVGYAFATQEGVLTLVRIYQKLRFRLTPGQEPLKMKVRLGFVPEEGVKVTVHRRQA